MGYVGPWRSHVPDQNLWWMTWVEKLKMPGKYHGNRYSSYRNLVQGSLGKSGKVGNSCGDEQKSTVTFTALWLIQQMMNWWYFFYFSQKTGFDIHTNCLQWKQFAWNIKAYCPGKIRKLQSNLVISNSLISNYSLSQSENLVPVLTWNYDNR